MTVEDSVWAQQLSMVSHDLACRINEAIGAPVLDRIRFRTGQVRPGMAWKAAEEKANAELYAEGARPDALGSSDLTALRGSEGVTRRRDSLIRKVADSIADEEIRSRFERLLVTDGRWQQWQRANLSPGSGAAAEVLRREPWLDDDEVRAFGRAGRRGSAALAAATTADLERARRVVAEECADEVDALVSAGGLDSPQGRVRVRLMVECITMLAARCHPGDVTDELVLRYAGPDYLDYLRRARGAAVPAGRGGPGGPGGSEGPRTDAPESPGA